MAGEDPIDSTAGSKRIASRYVLHPDHELAAQWLVERLESIQGLELERHAFPVMGEMRENYILKRLGTEPELPPVIVGAHYDSIASMEPEGTWLADEDPAPGADDNASGVVAVLELARLFSQPAYQTKRSIWFTLFTGEEVGLVGSYALAESLVEEGQAIRLMISLDPIGFNPADQYRLFYSYDVRTAPDADVVDQIASIEDTPLIVTGVDEALMGGDERSDHYPFWAAGFPALHFGNFPLSPNYHTLQDQFSDIDMTYLTATTHLTASILVEIGEVPEEEQSGVCGTAMIPSWPMLLWLPAMAAIRRRRPVAGSP